MDVCCARNSGRDRDTKSRGFHPPLSSLAKRVQQRQNGVSVGGFPRSPICSRRCRVQAEPSLPLEAEEEKHRLAAGVDGKHPARRPVPCVTINQSDERAALPFGPGSTLSVVERTKLPRRALSA